jgi:hypothetical protein
MSRSYTTDEQYERWFMAECCRCGAARTRPEVGRMVTSAAPATTGRCASEGVVPAAEMTACSPACAPTTMFRSAPTARDSPRRFGAVAAQRRANYTVDGCAPAAPSTTGSPTFSTTDPARSAPNSNDAQEERRRGPDRDQVRGQPPLRPDCGVHVATFHAHRPFHPAPARRHS